MSRIERDCPACGDASPQDTGWLVHDHNPAFRNSEYRVVTCKTCELVYISNPPVESEIAAHYSNDISSKMHREGSEAVSTLQKILLGLDTRKFLDGVNRDDLILDVGSGPGMMAHYLWRRGFSVGGIDFYDESLWRYPGIPFKSLDLNKVSFESADFSIAGQPAPRGIVMRHVLEHLYHPRALLTVFRASGLNRLLIIVPNYDSFLRSTFGDSWFYWDPPRHLSFFTRRSLTHLVQSAGYRVESLETYGIDEIFVSLWRKTLLKGSQANEAFGPKSLLSALSSGASYPFGNAVIRMVATVGQP